MMKKQLRVKSKTPVFSIVLYVIASVEALITVACLANNIYVFKDSLSTYVAQGYQSSVVLKQLIPTQLLPGIFEPVGAYGGIAFLLFSAGLINKKLSLYLALLYEKKCEVSAVTEIKNAEVAAKFEDGVTTDTKLVK